jgi:prepilin signal peptidase PulO-like enzyme (type II secretory pathway)
MTSGVVFLTLGIIIPGDYLKLVYSLILFVVLFSIFVVDLENQIIPDSFVFFGIIVSSVYYIFTNNPEIFPAIFVGFLAAAFLLCVHLLTKGRGMGLGDVKLAVLGGLITGPSLFLIWLLLAFLTGAIAGSILILAKRAHLKSQIAFGPFLVLAIPLTLIYGEKILFWLHFG